VIKGIASFGVDTLRRFRLKDASPIAEYETIVSQLSCPGSLLLDAGCGHESRASTDESCRVVGIDLDFDEAMGTPTGIDDFVVGALEHLPFRNEIFDVAMCYEVVEHLEKPHLFFSETNRVLRRGATLVVCTPNRNHYANAIVSLTGHSFHRWFVRAVLRHSSEVYPTAFRANTERRLIAMMRRAGLELAEMRLLDRGPIYLEWFTPAYALALVYHRLVSRFAKLSSLRSTILATFRKGGLLRE
jgi:2-polyprenyl-3-methyl-5-hydroxy-6-metoxy-1,4-benzoquinol methylase